jgi:hypothetical protein
MQRKEKRGETMSEVDGWYLMTADEVVREAERWKRDPDSAFSGFTRLSVADALAYRDAGNLPDDSGRSLRLVIAVDPDAGVDSVSAKRLQFEPDFHAAPEWRVPGSKPVNVVPLRARSGSRGSENWWDDPKIAPLEAEWKASGTVDGLPVPGDFRGFVYKTVIALRAAGREVTADSVADSVARWLGPLDVERLRNALKGDAAED